LRTRINNRLNGPGVKRFAITNGAPFGNVVAFVGWMFPAFGNSSYHYY
jgi:hypothetical protein